MTFISGIMKQSTKIFMLYPMVLKSSLFQVVQKYKLIYKVGRVFPMVIWSEFRLGEYRDDDHREDAPHFNIGCIIHSLHQDPAYGQILNSCVLFRPERDTEGINWWFRPQGVVKVGKYPLWPPMKLNLRTFGDIRFGPRWPEVPNFRQSYFADCEKVGPDIVGSIPASGYYFFDTEKRW